LFARSLSDRRSKPRCFERMDAQDQTPHPPPGTPPVPPPDPTRPSPRRLYQSHDLTRHRRRSTVPHDTATKLGRRDMWAGIVGLIIQLISGAAGGNVAGL